jgi:hypothetical protein
MLGAGGVVFGEGGRRGLPVLPRRRSPHRGHRRAGGDSQETARGDVAREFGDHGFAVRQVHQHPEQQHRVEAPATGNRPEPAKRAVG